MDEPFGHRGKHWPLDLSWKNWGSDVTVICPDGTTRTDPATYWLDLPPKSINRARLNHDLKVWSDNYAREYLK